MAYRLALDLGANSIGWCCFRLDAEMRPFGILAMGVRVFPDGRNPKDGSSNAAARRQPRAARRNRDRYLQRRTALLNALTRFGLMPADDEARRRIARLNPWPVRRDALVRRLEPEELGRAVFHLAQRRGFKSNRKTDRGNEEKGKIGEAADRLSIELHRTGSATLGVLLADRHDRREPVRARLTGTGAQARYDFYPTRDLIEAEFDAIWSAQSAWNPELSAEVGERLRKIVFHQRPLRAVPRGQCWLEPDEPRAFRAAPTFQHFRIAQDLSHLRLSAPGEAERTLTPDERRLLASHLHRGKNLAFDRVRALLKLPVDTDFNIRSVKRDSLIGDETAARLGSKKVLGDAWHRLSLDAQDSAVEALLEAEDATTLANRFADLGLSEDQARVAESVSLEDGTTSLSMKAMRVILPSLEGGLRYSDAVQIAGYAHHTRQGTGEIMARLPYYGAVLSDRIGTGTGAPEDDDEKRFGRATNPTVHVGLNELRRVVNSLIDRFGHPAQIHVEVLRELGRTKKQRQEIEREQAGNQRANERRAKMLHDDLRLPVNGRNLMRLRLWEEQGADPKNRVCPYSGTIITPRMALSDEIEEDHILPFALTLDDSPANRVLCTREANRAKARRSPFDAFGHGPDWEAIIARVHLLPARKRWRFQPDALKKFSAEGDFLARHLTETAWLTSLARTYLEAIAPDSVVAIPGQITAILRDELGLGSNKVLGTGGRRKDRIDHRHHVIDAVVVGLIDRSFLQKVQTAAKRGQEQGRRRFAEFPAPWPGFLDEVAARARGIIVSHKPDHGWQGALHNDTAYGPIAGARNGEPNVVVRRPLDLLAEKDSSAAEAVRDLALRGKLREILSLPDKQARRAELASLEHPAGSRVRRVRMVERLDSQVQIRSRKTGSVYKVLKRDSNHRAEVWRLPDGELRLTVISSFEAACEAEARRLQRPVPDLRPHPAARKLMELHKGDMVALGTGDQRRVLVVVNLDPGRLVFADNFAAGNIRERHRNPDDSFRYVMLSASGMKREAARKVAVTPSGEVRDPGPPKW